MLAEATEPCCIDPRATIESVVAVLATEGVISSKTQHLVVERGADEQIVTVATGDEGIGTVYGDDNMLGHPSGRRNTERVG